MDGTPFCKGEEELSFKPLAEDKAAFKGALFQTFQDGRTLTTKNLEYKADKSLPICASNETYLEEMRKLVQQRLTLGDQEGALVEVMRRNQEE